MVPSRRTCPLPLLGLLCLLAAPAFAARPMITDDARIVDAKACQVEAWHRFNRDSQDRSWAVPACNPTGNLELSVGGGQGVSDTPPGERQLAAGLVQAKTLFKPLTPDGWGIGLAVGRSFERTGQQPRAVSHYFYVPMSLALRGDDIVLHLNLGVRDDRTAHRSFATWGLGSEIRLAPQLQLIAETFGESRGGTQVHGGLRWWVIPDRVQIDATTGGRVQPGVPGRWMSVGVRLLTPAFLP